MPSVKFFSEDINFSLPHPRKTAAWIKETIKSEDKALGELNFIFCSDRYLYKINVQYLNHHSFTDIITFDNRDQPGNIEGDIFISIDRIKDNALKFERSFDEELHRVIIHGVLHLAGYADKKPSEKNEMRRKEDAYLSLRK